MYLVWCSKKQQLSLDKLNLIDYLIGRLINWLSQRLGIDTDKGNINSDKYALRPKLFSKPIDNTSD